MNLINGGTEPEPKAITLASPFWNWDCGMSSLFSIQCNVMTMSKKASLYECKPLKNNLTTVHSSRTWICICAKCFFINLKEVLRMTRPEVRAFPQLYPPLHRGSRSSLIQAEGSVWNCLVNGPRMWQSKNMAAFLVHEQREWNKQTFDRSAYSHWRRLVIFLDMTCAIVLPAARLRSANFFYAGAEAVLTSVCFYTPPSRWHFMCLKKEREREKKITWLSAAF